MAVVPHLRSPARRRSSGVLSAADPLGYDMVPPTPGTGYGLVDGRLGTGTRADRAAHGLHDQPVRLEGHVLAHGRGVRRRHGSPDRHLQEPAVGHRCRSLRRAARRSGPVKADPDERPCETVYQVHAPHRRVLEPELDPLPRLRRTRGHSDLYRPDRGRRGCHAGRWPRDCSPCCPV